MMFNCGSIGIGGIRTERLERRDCGDPGGRRHGGLKQRDCWGWLPRMGSLGHGGLERRDCWGWLPRMGSLELCDEGVGFKISSRATPSRDVYSFKEPDLTG
ncbi:unnamed protein product [Pieris brassicae]|uniref:Uncharacterized protein n=1 Tax=Pieris brassicae TaxID=7116 RepID=A0A9P0XL00_PIEBR|nr:unnamed protein product [Pieris brassicae]